MSLQERLAEYEAKRHRGERLLLAEAFEEARVVLLQAREVLDSVVSGEKSSLEGDLAVACERLVEKNLERGDYYLSERNFELARDCYRTALEIAHTPRLADEANIRLGQLEQKETPSATLQELYEKVMTSPTSPEALYDFAVELAMEGYLTEAIRTLERVVELTPDDAEVYYRLGNAYQDAGRTKESRAAYDKAIGQGFEDRAEIFYRLGTLALSAEGSHIEAKRYFKKGLECRADHLECLKRLADLELEENDVPAAMENIRAAIGVDPDDPALHLALGKLEEKQGQEERAREAYRKAISIDAQSDAAAEAQEALDRLEAAEDLEAEEE